jgi:predicted ATPase
VTLERAQLVRERVRVPEREYIFKHHLTQEAAYNGLLERERRAYHRRVAEALELLCPERIEERVELLAHHWEQAGEVEKAIHYLHQAGDKA